MKLYEHMAKEIFRNNGIPVPRGAVFTGVDGVADFVKNTGSVALKSQVLSGGRGKAGGIKFADEPVDAVAKAQELFGMDIKGFKVNTILIEEKIDVQKELYLAIAVDGARRKPVLLASMAGGMDIEQVPDDKLIKRLLDVTIGLQPYAAREIARQLGLTGKEAKEAADIIQKLYQIFRKYDAELVEINPLVVTPAQVMAADGKMTIDDDAFFRYQEDVPIVQEKTDLEKRAADIGISYVELDGEVGVMANGAGITMATLDMIQHFGSSARNFMDAGGGTSMEATAAALEILLETNPKALLINIFGGITRCDEVATAFVQVKKNMDIKIPFVIRLVGTNEDVGTKILQDNGIGAHKDIKDAVAEVCSIVNAKGV